MVITQVATHIAIDSWNQDFEAKSRAIFVANADVNTFTRLFQRSMVISNLSTLLFSNFNVLAQKLRFLISVSIVCEGIDMNAISLHEKNADKANNTTKIRRDKGSI